MCCYNRAMDCEERDRLKAIHVEALIEWTEVGGINPARGNDPIVVAAKAKLDEAKQAVFDHRKAHPC
jgi:hypothetical protein